MIFAMTDGTNAVQVYTSLLILKKLHDTRKEVKDIGRWNRGKNECIDVMVAMFGKEAVKHFCMCNAYKYRFRADRKNGAEDIEKAEWYESKLIELVGACNENS